jgi:hypothetical protein
MHIDMKVIQLDMVLDALAKQKPAKARKAKHRFFNVPCGSLREAS